jgi:hypothetical protein
VGFCEFIPHKLDGIRALFLLCVEYPMNFNKLYPKCWANLYEVIVQILGNIPQPSCDYYKIKN